MTSTSKVYQGRRASAWLMEKIDSFERCVLFPITPEIFSWQSLLRLYVLTYLYGSYNLIYNKWNTEIVQFTYLQNSLLGPLGKILSWLVFIAAADC